MNKKQAKVLFFLSLAAFALAFLINNRVWFRLDLTKNKAYTISDSTLNLYREISDPVKITYFVSDTLFLAHPAPGEIADFLREYAARSNGKIRFFRRDPAKAGLLGVMESLGITQQQIQIEVQNETNIATVYTGILIEYLDSEAVIPVIFSLETLEYDISARLRSLARGVKRELGVIVGDGYRDWNTDFSLLGRELLLAGFQVRNIQAGEEIPENLPALFVLGGAEDLDEHHLERLDRYIMGGGNVFFAVDGIYVNAMGAFEARAMLDQGLLAMLANYGAVIRRAMALDRNALSLTYQTGSGTSVQIKTERYPPWIAVLEDAGNTSHPVSERFGGLDLYWASPLELHPAEGVKAEVLFTGTAQGWLQINEFITAPAMMSDLTLEEAETRGTKILGAALSGNFPGFFEGVSKASRLVVVGDTDFTTFFMQLNRGEARNLEFLVRTALWLSGEDDLISIRGREASAGRLDRITDRDKKNAVMAFSRVLGVFLIPLGVAFTGLLMISRRKKITAKEREDRGRDDDKEGKGG